VKRRFARPPIGKKTTGVLNRNIRLDGGGRPA